MKGRTLLKVCSVLLMIHGVIGTVVLVYMVLPSSIGNSQNIFDAAGGTTAYIAYGLEVFSTVIRYAAGVLGLIFAGKVKKGNVCVVVGASLIGLFVAMDIWALIAGELNVYALPFNYLLPAGYLVGAILCKKALAKIESKG